MKNRMVTIGTGPGPKNVLVETPDGKRFVTAYALWKYKYKEEVIMADRYITVAGFIQFPVEEREIESLNTTVRKATIKNIGEAGALISISFFPEFDELELEEGDFIAVDGKYTQNDTGDKVYHNLTAYEVWAGGSPFAKKEREVANKKAKKTAGRF